MTEYSPNNWVILKMTYKEEIFYKVLGGWYGGYLHGSSWRLSSIIERCEYNVYDDVLVFHNHSGSTYRCHPDNYGLRMSTVDAYTKMKKQYPDQVELMEENTYDWTKFNYGETK